MARAIRFKNRVLHSGFEKKVLKDLEERHVPYEYEPYNLWYTLDKKYKPDLILEGGTLVEIKGYLRPEDRTKLLAIRRRYPDLPLKLVFQKAGNKLSKTSKTTYGEWATKHGFEWAEGSVPEEWL